MRDSDRTGQDGDTSDKLEGTNRCLTITRRTQRPLIGGTMSYADKETNDRRQESRLSGGLSACQTCESTEQ